MRFTVGILAGLLVICFGGVTESSADSGSYRDTTSTRPDRHNPYDLDQAAPVDSTDVYSSSTNYFLALPRYLWSLLVYPVGEFTIYAERVKLVSKYYNLFINDEGTFGVFPQFQLGGETGTGGGVRLFHTNLWGRRKIFGGSYIYSGGTGQMGEGFYLDPSFLGSGLTWKIEGGFLRTRNREANINGAIRDDKLRLFRIDQGSVGTTMKWQNNAGSLAPFMRQFSIEGRFGFSRRDFRAWYGGAGVLTDAGSSAEARTLRGLGQKYEFYSFGGRISYDDRDYSRPTTELSLPPNYKLPGRNLLESQGRYHYFRDLGYPERGGLFALEGDWV
jgi:hypothetical protein